MAIDYEQPIFVISVAAELADMHPQTLRQYDRLGIVSPSRAPGKSRRYSQRDITMLREVQRLSQEGVSLEGIKRILQLENQVAALQRRVAELSEELERRPRSPGLPHLRRRSRGRRRQPGPRQAPPGPVPGHRGVAAAERRVNAARLPAAGLRRPSSRRSRGKYCRPRARVVRRPERRVQRLRDFRAARPFELSCRNDWRHGQRNSEDSRGAPHV